MAAESPEKNGKINRFARLFPEKSDRIKKVSELAQKKIKTQNIGIIVPGGNGQIPVLYAKGKCLPEAWENSLIVLCTYGALLKTQYDKEGEGR